MKVHPLVPKKRNITLRYDIASALSQSPANASARPSCRQKKLRRLPHVFAKVLELPFHSEADVFIQDTPDSLRFVVNTDDDDDAYADPIGHDVRAHTIEIYPGVTKIVVRGSNLLDLSLDGLEIDFWRFRLPAYTRPELASAAYYDGELVVTVPKGVDPGGDDGDGDGGVNGGIGTETLVLVQ